MKLLPAAGDIGLGDAVEKLADVMHGRASNKPQPQPQPSLPGQNHRKEKKAGESYDDGDRLFYRMYSAPSLCIDSGRLLNSGRRIGWIFNFGLAQQHISLYTEYEFHPLVEQPKYTCM